MEKIRIELIYDKDCPNAASARTALTEALTQVGLPVRWQEWERSCPTAPAYVQSWGSPTILVEQKDVGASGSGDGKACRIYVNGKGQVQGSPSVQMIRDAIERRVLRRKSTETSRSFLVALPAGTLAFIPGVTCAACWPAYATLASSLGLGFFNYTPFLLPATAVLLTVAIGSMAVDACHLNSWHSLAVAGAGALGVLVFSFFVVHDAGLYSSIGLLMGASIWNMRAKRHARYRQCTACH